MKLFLDKDKCEITQDINGRVLIVKTDEPVYIEELNAKMQKIKLKIGCK